MAFRAKKCIIITDFSKGDSSDMWTRKELKMRGKAAFKANFWRCVLVAFILTLIGGAIGSAGGRAAADNAPVIAPEKTTVPAFAVPRVFKAEENRLGITYLKLSREDDQSSLGQSFERHPSLYA